MPTRDLSAQIRVLFPAVSGLCTESYVHTFSHQMINDTSASSIILIHKNQEVDYATAYTAIEIRAD